MSFNIHLRKSDPDIISELRKEIIPFSSIENAPFAELKRRIGDACIVLLGESTHGSSEFYKIRAELTKYLIMNCGFNIVALEADWPDVAQVNRYIHHEQRGAIRKSFTRFPQWMWRNQEFLDFINWLRKYNGSFENKEKMVTLNGLDLYSLYSSIDEVLRYLEQKDPTLAHFARENYSCLMPWKGSPSEYGSSILYERYKSCEEEVLNVLKTTFEHTLKLEEGNGRFLDIFMNANLVVDAEKYYRTMYNISSSTWNIRDKHMFDTLEYLLAYTGETSKAIVWAHNSHVGNAAATEMGLLGEFNIGQLCREKYQDSSYLIGFGTNTGTVAAATNWDGDMEVKELLPARKDSYEYLFHNIGIPSFFLPLKQELKKSAYQLLLPEKLERAVGVIYRPDTEYKSHYFSAILPKQFDEYIWFDKTHAITPLLPKHLNHLEELPETYPFGF